ncbi:MAG TPA: hypothetical protein VGN86_11685 [Pyrinomonadaceae bacterium]|nr:hypothetical protein [Pyrinomonadaceae bacterium]
MDAEQTIKKQYQRMIILWFAILGSISLLFIMMTIVAPGRTEPPAGSDRILVLALTIVAVSLVLVSLIMKQRLLRLSVDRQDPRLVQSTMILGSALSEAAALFGLVLRFVTGWDKFYLLFVLAVAGLLLHFPRRSNLVAASAPISLNKQV